MRGESKYRTKTGTTSYVVLRQKILQVQAGVPKKGSECQIRDDSFNIQSNLRDHIQLLIKISHKPQTAALDVFPHLKSNGRRFEKISKTMGRFRIATGCHEEMGRKLLAIEVTLPLACNRFSRLIIQLWLGIGGVHCWIDHNMVLSG